MPPMPRYSPHIDAALEAFAQAILAERANRQLSRQALADMAGVSINTIENIEVGTTRPRLATFLQIVEALEWDPADVITRITEEAKCQ